MSDLLERLRKQVQKPQHEWLWLCFEAATYIERLTKERDEARLQDPNQWRREYWKHYNDLNARATTLAADLAKAMDALTKIANGRTEIFQSAIMSFSEAQAIAFATMEQLTKTNEPEEDDEHFLVAYVSKDTKVIGIEHPTGASFEDVLAAHIALRDRLNVRIEEQDNCPFSASVGKS